MQLRPLGKRLIVKRFPQETTTASGLILATSAAEKPDRGQVVAVGSSVTEVAAGDEILFGKYSGHTVKVEGEELLVMTTDDVLAVVGA